jgi:hypothetical protein
MDTAIMGTELIPDLITDTQTQPITDLERTTVIQPRITTL